MLGRSCNRRQNLLIVLNFYQLLLLLGRLQEITLYPEIMSLNNEAISGEDGFVTNDGVVGNVFALERKLRISIKLTPRKNMSLEPKTRSLSNNATGEGDGFVTDDGVVGKVFAVNTKPRIRLKKRCMTATDDGGNTCERRRQQRCLLWGWWLYGR